MGAGISEGDSCGTHKPPRPAQGGGCALWACGPLVLPLGVFLVPKILKYSIKNHTKFAGHLEHFSFQDIF